MSRILVKGLEGQGPDYWVSSSDFVFLYCLCNNRSIVVSKHEQRPSIEGEGGGDPGHWHMAAKL